MSAQESGDSCGSHGIDKAGEPLFNYTCDDCMLAGTLDPEDIDRFCNRYAQYDEYMKASYGDAYNQERIEANEKFAEDEQLPF